MRQAGLEPATRCLEGTSCQPRYYLANIHAARCLSNGEMHLSSISIAFEAASLSARACKTQTATARRQREVTRRTGCHSEAIHLIPAERSGHRVIDDERVCQAIEALGPEASIHARAISLAAGLACPGHRRYPKRLPTRRWLLQIFCVPRIVSHSSTAPAWDTSPRPSADTVTRLPRALFFTWKVPSARVRTGLSTSPILPGQRHFFHLYRRPGLKPGESLQAS